MATKSKLEQAVERQIGGLNDAQKELVRSQLSVYRRNDARLAQIESEQKAASASQAATREAARERQAKRASLAYEHGQLSTANARIAAELFEFLGDR